MEWCWTWTGKSFGARVGDELWTCDGRHIGRFRGEEVFGPDGFYLGELRKRNRLITNMSKKSLWVGGFVPHEARTTFQAMRDETGLAVCAGHEDFPGPSHF